MHAGDMASDVGASPALLMVERSSTCTNALNAAYCKDVVYPVHMFTHLSLYTYFHSTDSDELSL